MAGFLEKAEVLLGRIRGSERLGGAEIAQFSKDGRVLVISGNGGKISGNEDYAAAAGGRLVIADGIGSGKTLSALAAKRACEAFTDLESKTFAEAAQSAHRAILQLADSRHAGIEAQNLGCVVAVASVENNAASLSNLGDARWLHVRGAQTLNRSEDDVSPGTSVVRSGISARATEDFSRFDPAQVKRVTLERGDLLFLFSDGLHHGGIDFESELCAAIEAVVSSGAEQSKEVLAHRIKERLSGLAQAKSRDNISLVIYCHGERIVEVFKRRAVEMERLRTAEAARLAAAQAAARAAIEARNAAPAASGASPVTVSSDEDPEPVPEPVPAPTPMRRGIQPVSLSRALGIAALVGCGSLPLACGGVTALAISIAAAKEIGREIGSLPWGDWVPHMPELPQWPKGELDWKTFWKPVCDQTVRGQWTLAADSSGDLATLTEYAGKMVIVTVADSSGHIKVQLQNLPAECLAGSAPLAIAAEQPVKTDLVGIQYGSVTNYYHFKPMEAIKDLAKDASAQDLKIENGGELWLSCAAPVSEGCRRDWAVLDGRK